METMMSYGSKCEVMPDKNVYLPFSEMTNWKITKEKINWKSEILTISLIEIELILIL